MNSDSKRKRLIGESVRLVSLIRLDYPELYKIIDETPIDSSFGDSDIPMHEYEEFINTLSKLINVQSTRVGATPGHPGKVKRPV